MTLWHIDGYDIDPEKIHTIWMGGESREDVGGDNACLVYMDGGHIHNFRKEDGMLIRKKWRRMKGTTMDLKRDTRLETPISGDPPPEPRVPLGVDHERR